MTKNGILGVGVATLDIYVNQKRMYPGGNEYNVVCNAKKLGARAGFLGVYGNDKAGEILEETLVREGVEVTHSHHETGSSGYSLVEMSEDGDRNFLMWNQEGVTDLYPVSFTEEEIAYAKTYAVTTIGLLANVSLEKIKLLHDNGVDLSYDFNSRFTDEQVMEIAPLIKYGFFSCSHLNVEEIQHFLKLAVDHGCRLAVGTRGADPVIAYDGIQFYKQETCKVEVLDALGAGDSYIAAVLVNYLRNLEDETLSAREKVQKALEAAVLYSAKVVQIEGGIGVGYDVDPSKVNELVNI